MNHCETCGKLIEGSRGHTQCHACRVVVSPPALKSHQAPVVPTTQPETNADEAERSPFSDVPCIRCRSHNALVDSEFCLSCQLELLNLLGDAAYEVAQTPPPPPKPPVASSVSLMNDVEEKRERTAMSHIRVVGGARLK